MFSDYLVLERYIVSIMLLNVKTHLEEKSTKIADDLFVMLPMHVIIIIKNALKDEL